MCEKIFFLPRTVHFNSHATFVTFFKVIFDSPTGTMERQQSSGTPAASSGEPSLDLNEVRSGMHNIN
jgi:hypothetical protein